MKALVKIHPGIGHVELIDMPEPTIGEGQVIIEVKAAGICGTDTHIYNDEYGNDPPVILGHEISGEVVEVDRHAGTVTLQIYIKNTDDTVISPGRAVVRLGD